MNFATKAVQRTASPSRQSLFLLAPAQSTVPGSFTGSYSNSSAYRYLLSRMQRFRGATYLKDGAITQQALDSEGRHRAESDAYSWHVLTVDEDGEVRGCSRYTPYRGPVDFEKLGVGRSALAHSDVWGPKLKAAIERERKRAAHHDTSFVEVGGWAISETLRGTTEALRIALATYALADRLGGCIGVTTATVRHQSASILRKIGGQPLSVDNTDLPRYFDPQYECEMEILRFHSAEPNAKFVPWINQISAEMSTVPVLAPQPEVAAQRVPEKSADYGMGLQVAYGW
jgi:hypothetical protein